jgi:predicted RNase H-like HicB family nuclease
MYNPNMPKQRFDVVLIPSDEGFAVGCLALPGCWSQGETRAEALVNIADAIHEYLLSVVEMLPEGETEQVEVEVPCLDFPAFTIVAR